MTLAVDPGYKMLTLTLEVATEHFCTLVTTQIKNWNYLGKKVWLTKLLNILNTFQGHQSLEEWYMGRCSSIMEVFHWS